ncbi:MAG: TonB family protein [Rhizobiales bacterium]|nr:TonB family protein [Hyphomicrobiales bacterium]
MQVRAVDIVLNPGGVDRRRPAGNVVPFLRPDAEVGRATIGGIDRDARPAPISAVPFSRGRLASFVIVSLAFHAVVFAAFQREAPPLSSVGVQSISVEIVLGTNAAAGLAEKPIQADAAISAASAQGEAPDLVKPETARQEIKTAEVATPVEPVQAPVAVKPEQTPPPSREVAEARPAEQQTDSESPSAEVAAAEPEAATEPPQAAVGELQVPVAEAPKPAVESAKPVAEPLPTTAETPTVVETVTVPPRRPRPIVRRQRNRRGEDARTRRSRTSSASVASSGIGRGRSDAISNYRGLVASQLARNKHFPPDARRNGDEGRAVVAFTINSGGGVSRVALVRGTGVATLDREAQAMVHRASPFPPPPSQQSMRFTVPVSFNIQ